jgi:serine/threonine-protein kinase HipA
MKLAGEAIARSTKWGCMKDVGSDYSPDWGTICNVVAGDGVDGDQLADGLLAFADALESAPDIALSFGANPDAVDQATSACSEIVEGLRLLRPAPILKGR